MRACMRQRVVERNRAEAKAVAAKAPLEDAAAAEAETEVV